MLRRTAAVLALVAALGGLSACGNKESEITRASSEAAYLDLSGLKYQVQISRQFNPADPGDRDFLTNLPAEDETLPAGVIWFGVYMRVENEQKRAIESASDFTIKDTQGNLFKPIQLDNPLAYKPELIAGGGISPDLQRPAAVAGAQGLLLLFKIPSVSLDNRPLALTIRSPEDPSEAAVVDLDV